MKVGLELVLSENPWLGRAPHYAEVRELALTAEAAGFDSLWLYDHLLYRTDISPAEGIWEGWTMLSALADATQRVELGTLVSCGAFRNPALLAKMAVTLDEVSGGRLTLGLGAGWNDAELTAFGMPLDHRVSRFEEALQIIVPLVREGRVSYEGQYHRAVDCEILPRGPRPAGPPILVAGFGPRMLRLVAKYADCWNGGYAARAEDLNELRSRLTDACVEVGRDPSSLAVTTELKVSYPDLTPTPNLFGDRFATGSATAVAATLSEFERAGFAHLMCTCSPNTPEALQRLAAAVACYRESSAA